MRSKGFTIIELMIALVLGLVVSGAVIGAFIVEKRNFTQSQELARMQDNARFAMSVISRDLLMADYWGGMTLPEDITLDASLVLPGSDCGGGTSWEYAPGDAIDVKDDGSTANAVVKYPCLTASELSTVNDGTNDITATLSIKHVGGAEVTALVNNTVYLRTNGTTGTLLRYQAGVTVAPAATDSDWLHNAHVYFIRNFSQAGDAVPTLTRIRLATGPTMVEEALADGIEYFHVMFGLDFDGDGAVNRFVSNPTAAQLEQAVAATIYVLARSANADRDYTNDKAYTLGDVSIPAVNDNFYRRVYTSTIQLRNVTYRTIMNAT